MKIDHEQEPNSEVPLAERIARRAYAHWEADGCPEGADLRYWLRAETEVLEESDRSLSDQSPEQV